MIRSSSDHAEGGGKRHRHGPSGWAVDDQSVTAPTLDGPWEEPGELSCQPYAFAKITVLMTFRAIEGGGVLLLLSVFFAYLLAPAVAGVRRRIRLGRRQRPISDATAIALLYIVVFVPAAIVWRGSGDRVSHWVHVTAPESVDH